jgi:SGNH domain-containing protein
VILGSRWLRERGGLDEKIGSTARFLRDAGVKKIILVGSPLRWPPTLRDILEGKFKTENEVPSTLPPSEGAFDEASELDAQLSAVSARYNIEYVSILKAFCDAGRCLIKVGTNLPGDLITADYDHLTAASSEYLADKARIGERIAAF